jgi:outer membrane receptor protein involved in Fe transport
LARRRTQPQPRSKNSRQRKRETNLQQTPIAITAITQEQIQLNRIEDFADIALHTPSMSYTELQGFSQASIRGVGTDLTNLANETAIAMYEDGVYRGATFSQTVPQFDMERIEVLRGPQGTLYGRNATGGAINIVTRMPSTAGVQRVVHRRQLRERVSRRVGSITDGVLGRQLHHRHHSSSTTTKRWEIGRRRKPEGRSPRCNSIW